MAEIKFRLLDLFCGAGGASMGYHRAGFEVYGIDNKFQPHYPFPLIEIDALQAMDALLNGKLLRFKKDGHIHILGVEDFSAFHASPPCQFGSRMTAKHCRKNHINLLPQTRRRLIDTSKPFVIENIPDNRRHLVNPLMLCGTMFGLYLHRHRYFETSPEMYFFTRSCVRIKEPVLVTGCSRRKNGRREYRVGEIREAMDIDWMIKTELDEAIPPAYTECIGKYLLQAIIASDGIK